MLAKPTKRTLLPLNWTLDVNTVDVNTVEKSDFLNDYQNLFLPEWPFYDQNGRWIYDQNDR